VGLNEKADPLGRVLILGIAAAPAAKPFSAGNPFNPVVLLLSYRLLDAASSGGVSSNAIRNNFLQISLQPFLRPETSTIRPHQNCSQLPPRMMQLTNYHKCQVSFGPLRPFCLWSRKSQYPRTFRATGASPGRIAKLIVGHTMAHEGLDSAVRVCDGAVPQRTHEPCDVAWSCSRRSPLSRACSGARPILRRGDLTLCCEMPRRKSCDKSSPADAMRYVSRAAAYAQAGTGVESLRRG